MFKWKNLRTDTVHANELLEADTLCGKLLFELDGAFLKHYQAAEADAEVTCLNCEREIRRIARSGEQYREWMGKPSAWHPRFGPKPSPFAHKHGEGRALVVAGWDGRSQPMYRYADEMHLPDATRSIVKPEDRP